MIADKSVYVWGFTTFVKGIGSVGARSLKAEDLSRFDRIKKQNSGCCSFKLVILSSNLLLVISRTDNKNPITKIYENCHGGKVNFIYL